MEAQYQFKPNALIRISKQQHITKLKTETTRQLFGPQVRWTTSLASITASEV